MVNMNKMFCPLLLMATIHGVSSATSQIFPPIRSDGADVALVFVPETGVTGDAYNATARAAQESTFIRLWVVFTVNYTDDNPANGLSDVMAATFYTLERVGFRGNNYVAAGHGDGGRYLSIYAKSSPLKAIVLLGAFLAKGDYLNQYPIPVLTLAGELDGVTRITRVAEMFDELEMEVEHFMNQSAMYLTPVISIRGSCHAQFASGQMPSEISKYDLQPEVTEDAAHKVIGGHISSFLSTTFNIGNVTQAKQNLSKAYTDSGNLFLPLLDIRDMDNPEDRRPALVVILQLDVAADLSTRIGVFPSITTNASAFYGAAPNITKSSGNVEVQVNIYNYLAYPNNHADISRLPVSPQETDLKLVSYDAIKAALGQGGEDSINITSCKDMNQYALDTAVSYSGLESLHRYKASGRPIRIEDDVTCRSDDQWESTPLNLEDQDDGLHVKAVTFITPVHGNEPGVFYCKVMSPYRAMEWIYVDSLRKQKPT